MRFNAIRITIDAFLLLASIVFGVLKKLYQDLTNLIRI
ncbi:putative membrane protein [Helicobacter pylori NQ4110]|nr:putative membrane protein [Helicobacter pylori NQ4110]